MTRFALLLLCLALCLSVVGCGSAQVRRAGMPDPSPAIVVDDAEALAEAAPEPGTATLFLIDEISNSLTSSRLIVNGAEAAVVDQGVVRLPLLPGTHELAYEVPTYTRLASRTVELAAGERAWIQIQFNVDSSDPYAVTEHDRARGERLVRKARRFYALTEAPQAYLPGPEAALRDRCLAEEADLEACLRMRTLPAVLRTAAFDAQIASGEARARERLAMEERLRAREATLPAEVRRDKYMVSLTALLGEERYADALPVFDQLAALEVALDPAFDYFYGEALLRTGDAAGALERLYRYVSRQGNTAAYYRDALVLINEAEQAL